MFIKKTLHALLWSSQFISHYTNKYNTIHCVFRPNLQEKRRSKDMETITEAELLSQCMGATPCPLPRTLEEGTINSTTGLLQLLRDHTARRSTVGPGDPIEIVANQNNPFLGESLGVTVEIMSGLEVAI